ncbi:MFS transporter, partial [Escherichia coli]
MLFGAGLLATGLFLGPLAVGRFEMLVALWLLLGIGYSLAQTPSGRLLRRSANEEDRPALFAAQFALSHACWLITYPMAGWMGARVGLNASFLALGTLAALTTIMGMWLWPSDDPAEVPHTHPDMPAEHA